MFVELVDLVGGVEFYVPQDMNYDDDWQDLHIHLEEGLQVLDGNPPWSWSASGGTRRETSSGFRSSRIS